MQSDWDTTARQLGYPGEKEMWVDLYPKNSMTQLALKFSKGINTIRARIDYFQIPKRARGGANNVKVEVSKELLDDCVNLGIHAAAVKWGIKPQTLYQRLYYRHGMTVKKLKEAAQRSASTECDSEPQSSEESLPDVQGDK